MWLVLHLQNWHMSHTKYRVKHFSSGLYFPVLALQVGFLDIQSLLSVLGVLQCRQILQDFGNQVAPDARRDRDTTLSLQWHVHY